MAKSMGDTGFYAGTHSFAEESKKTSALLPVPLTTASPLSILNEIILPKMAQLEIKSPKIVELQSSCAE